MAVYQKLKTTMSVIVLALLDVSNTYFKANLLLLSGVVWLPL